jgi:hypothetical protein
MPEKRKVGGSTPPLTTTDAQGRRWISVAGLTFCRRANITVKNARFARVLRMALCATRDCDVRAARTGTSQEDRPNSTHSLGT